MEKKKLKLEEVQINSFVTAIKKQEKQTVDGGATPVIAAVIASVAISVNSIVELSKAQCSKHLCVTEAACHSNFSCPTAWPCVTAWPCETDTICA